MSGFIERLVLERKKLEDLRKLHPEILLEYLSVEQLLRRAGATTVDEILSNGSVLRSELKAKCAEIYEQIIQRRSLASSSEVLIGQWLERASSKEHGYGTGYGHYISNKRLFDKMGSYWVIRPEHFENVKPTLWESFAFLVREETYCLSPDVTDIRWGN